MPIPTAFPTLTYAEAELIGLRIKRAYKGLTGKKKTPRLKDETWADVVQTIMRHARASVEGRPDMSAPLDLGDGL